MSGITNKVRDALSGREHTTESTKITTHHRAPTAGAVATTEVPTTNTTSGAYRSDMPHQHDHRVAPEALGTRTTGKTAGLGGHGSHQDPTNQDPHRPVFVDHVDPGHTGGGAYNAGAAPQGYFPGSTTQQEQVTSGSDQRQGVGATGVVPGSYPTTTAGPHSTDFCNKLDPRVDSDRDGSTTLGQDHTTRTGGNTTTAAPKATVPTTTSSAQYPGPAPHTAGPHKYDILNKLDPRVDSDLDGSRTIGGATGNTTKPGTY